MSDNIENSVGNGNNKKSTYFVDKRCDCGKTEKGRFFEWVRIKCSLVILYFLFSISVIVLVWICLVLVLVFV